MSIQVIADEADKKRAEQREQHRRRQIDRTAIRSRSAKTPDEEIANLSPWRFKWVNSKERGVANAVEGIGFELVKKDDDAIPPHAKWDEALGAYRLGQDLILAKETRERYEERRADANDRMDRAYEASIGEGREKINRIARDEGRGPAHTDVTFSETVEGPAEIRVRQKPKG